MKIKKAKKLLLGILFVVVAVALIFSPYLLVVDFERYSSLVFIIWILSVAYYLFLKRRVDRHLKYRDWIKNKESEDQKSKN